MMMNPDLSRRLGSALGTHVVTLDERDAIVAASEDPTVRDWPDLSVDVQRLVTDIEERVPAIDQLPSVPGPTRI